MSSILIIADSYHAKTINNISINSILVLQLKLLDKMQAKFSITFKVYFSLSIEKIYASAKL